MTFEKPRNGFKNFYHVQGQGGQGQQHGRSSGEKTAESKGS